MNNMQAAQQHNRAWGFKPRHLVIIAILLVIFIPALYFFATRSDAFDAADQFSRTSMEVSKRVGTVSDVGLRFLDGFHVTFAGSGGEASFVLDVKGDKGDAVVDVRLRRAANVWRVEHAYLTTKTEKGIPIASPSVL